MTNLLFYIGPIIGVAVTVASLIFVFRIFGNLAKANKEHARLLQVGHRAAGRVAFAQQTGTYVNNNPQIALRIDVTPPGGVPYQVQMNKIVSMLELPQYQLGAQLDVRIDPANPNNIAIVGPLQPPMGGPHPGGYPHA